MGDRDVRMILLKLVSHLCDNDRERLHFLLTTDFPRLFSGDASLSGTFGLIQSLFDQDEINEKDLTCLINAFEQIRCFDAANCLKEYQYRMFGNGDEQSKVCSVWMLPSRDDMPLTVGENNHPTKATEGRGFVIFSNKGESETYSSKQRCLFSPCVLFGLMLVTLTIVTIGGMKYVHGLKNHLQNEDNLIIKGYSQNINQLNVLLAEKDTLIEKLNKTLIESQTQPTTSLIRPGRKFGGNGGAHFDDSLLPSFTSTDYLSGIIVSQSNELDSCEFIYSSLLNNKHQIKSHMHGLAGHGMNNFISTYHLEHDERIKGVTVTLADKTFITSEEGLFTTRIVKGIQFITTKDRRIPADLVAEDDDDHVESESFPGYTLGYATGRTGLMIDQLQFFWYRTGK